MNTYFSIHNHTHYSFLDGFSEPKDYLEKCRELGISGFAITEHGNILSSPYFEKLKKDYSDIKIVYGVELYEASDIKEKNSDSKYFHLVLLVKNERGRIDLNDIITKSNFEGFYYKPRVDLKMLSEYEDNFIITSGCLASKLAKENDFNKCIEYIKEYKNIFSDFYLEMQSHKSIEQKEYNKKILDLSKAINTKFVITTDSHSATKEDLYYQNQFVKIAKDLDSANEIYDGCYVQSIEEIHNIMDSQIGKENVSIGLDNTLEILNKIEDVKIPFQEPKLPHIVKNENDVLLKLVDDGFKKRNINKNNKTYNDRVIYEIDSIKKIGFAGYFIILQDIINWAKDNDILVGVGRGSAGGSLVCYLIGITDIDPIKYDLIFERFLSIERVNMPDIDFDVSDRQKVLEYIEKKYGSDNVCQVINFSYITPKVAIKDTARILNIDYKKSEEISSFFIDENFENNNVPKKYLEEYSKLFEIAKKINGKIRQTSTHACAVCVSDSNLNNYMPRVTGSKQEKVISADKRIVEEIGLVKLDVLGLETLNVINNTLKIIGKNYNYISPDNEDMLNDKETYDLICKGDTLGVFQLESFGMRELVQKVLPSNVFEVSDILALYRPDAMPYIDDYIKNKKNILDIEYFHPDYEDILRKSYGVMIYQESLMEIVRKFGGRDYAGSDKFRKAIGKKNPELVKYESEILYKEILENGYDKSVAEKISLELGSKGSYLFNKSHSLQYSIITIQTAYLKAHHPIEFYCALLNSVKNDSASISKYIQDATQNGVNILVPNINKSEVDFSVKDGKILFGLSAIKGIGSDLANNIVENQPYNNFQELDEEVKLAKDQVIQLIKSGAFGKNKELSFEKYFNTIQSEKKEFKPRKTVPSPKDALKYNIIEKDTNKRLELFNIIKKNEFYLNYKTKIEKEKVEFYEKYYSKPELWEFESLNMFLTSTPFGDFDISINKKGLNFMVGIITDVKNKKSKKTGKKYVYLDIYDGDNIIETVCWNTQFVKYQSLIKKGQPLALLIDRKDGIIIKKMKDFYEWKKEKTLDK